MTRAPEEDLLRTAGDRPRIAFEQMWAEIGAIGRDPAGGFSRLAWSAADAELRAWFRRQAAARDMSFEQDRNGNMWAWWNGPGPDAVVTGSHLDSVPNGGAFDGPLGVASGFLALDDLRERAIETRRPVAVVGFSDEEGARFGMACVGSRLMTGALDPDAARALVDADGTTLAQAMSGAGADPAAIGPDPARLALIGAFVELHIEQGRALVDMDAPVGAATAIWPHGRWRCSFHGEANHAGTTLLEDRRDPMLPFAATVLEARRVAALLGARATFAKIEVQPNATNAIAARLDAWLDARAPDDATLAALVAEVAGAARLASLEHGVTVEVTGESLTGVVELEQALRARISAALGEIPELATAAGHDAGTLSGHVPTAMLFVRNPTGISHSPAEHAKLHDCLAGIGALARVIEDLAFR
ncbi:MAG: allantoate amidohydrolase [Acidimicrobiaceae bacterium]|jgi:N-carbamoyl-L-amino-acid hydrolase|nr:allantoate amidohydrolase [Acidimicrobiaceae bacterium]